MLGLSSGNPTVYGVLVTTIICCFGCLVVFDSLQPHGLLQPAKLLCPWDFLGKNTGVGCYFLPQGIFLTQGLNPCLLLDKQILTAEPSGKPLDNLLFLKYFQKTLPRSCMCCFLSSYCIIPEMPSLHTPSIAGGSLLKQRIQFKVTLTQPGLRSSSSGPPANNNRTYDLLFRLVLYDSSLIEYKLWGPFIHIYHFSAFSVLAQMQEVARTKN